MKRLILQNTLISQILIFVGMALIMWPTALRIFGVINFGNDFSAVFLYAGAGVMLAGLALRIYQQQQAGDSAFRNYLFRVAAGIAVAAIMMLTGIIKTPSFLHNLLQGN